MKQLLTKTLRNEDWVIVMAGAVVLILAAIFRDLMPVMPKQLSSLEDGIQALYMFAFLTLLTYAAAAVQGKANRYILPSLLLVFVITCFAQITANIPAVKEYGFETVFFAVIYGLILNNVFNLPTKLKNAVNSEFFIKIGIICLGSTILFGEMMKSGAFGLLQAYIVVFAVWYFCYWLGNKMKVDPEMNTMLSSAVSICGVSAAIATCGVIRGDNKKLSYVVSLVLIVAVPMMYLLPWLADLMGLPAAVAGAWMGGTIDTTGAVAAAGTLLDDPEGAETAIIVKSSQNVLLGLAAFFISLLWSYRGKNQQERPTAGVIWERFPKFVVGMIVASLVFSFCFDTATAKEIGKVTKGLQNTLFSVAFVCIGLETRFSDIIKKDNRRALATFLIAQTFHIIVTLCVAYLIFGVLRPAVD